MRNLFNNIQHVKAFYRDPIAFLQTQSKTAITSFGMAHLPFHHIIGLEEIKQVLVYEQKKFIKTPQAQYFTSLALGEGLVSTDGEKWLTQRKAANQLFRPQVMDGLVNTMHVELKKILSNEKWVNTEINLNRLMMDITLQLIFKVTFGEVEGLNTQAIAEAMEIMIEETYKRVIAPINWPLFIPTSSNLKFNKSRAQYDQLIQDWTVKSLENPDENALIYHYFTQDKHPDTSAVLAMKTAFKTLIAAGHETTATSLTWLFIELGRNPTIAFEMREELLKVDLDQMRSMAELLQQTPFTQQVINETLRLYPPIWLMGRMANERVEIGDIFMKRKDNVLISPFIVHRLASYWENPNTFKPSRFAHKNLNFTDAAYFPFGLGPRQCIGGRLAIVEMLIILANLYQQFEVSITNQTTVNYHPYITLRPASAIQVRLTALQ
ncbi:MAG: cytochrome P450 [Flammeovirgaceae bacterium]